MNHHVCSQPYMGVELFSPSLVAVCMGCYAIVMGLFTTCLLFIADNRKAVNWLHQHGWNGAARTVLIVAYPLIWQRKY